MTTDDLLMNAARYLIWDGNFGPITPDEWEHADGSKLPNNPREYVFSRADRLPEDARQELKLIYGRI